MRRRRVDPLTICILREFFEKRKMTKAAEALKIHDEKGTEVTIRDCKSVLAIECEETVLSFLVAQSVNGRDGVDVNSSTSSEKNVGEGGGEEKKWAQDQLIRLKKMMKKMKRDNKSVRWNEVAQYIGKDFTGKECRRQYRQMKSEKKKKKKDRKEKRRQGKTYSPAFSMYRRSGT